MRAGIILAPNNIQGAQAKVLLGLKYWYVVTPKSLVQGRGRGIQCEPRVIVVDSPDHRDAAELWQQNEHRIAPIFASQKPRVWFIRALEQTTTN